MNTVDKNQGVLLEIKENMADFSNTLHEMTISTVKSILALQTSIETINMSIKNIQDRLWEAEMRIAKIEGDIII